MRDEAVIFIHQKLLNAMTNNCTSRLAFYLFRNYYLAYEQSNFAANSV